MSSKQYASRNLLLLVSAIAATAAPIVSFAATLTGVVHPPSQPNSPAVASTVTVEEMGTGKRTLVDTTDQQGRYAFQDIPTGTRVQIKASWRPSQSLPGYAATTVSRDPTKQDVQLQPPFSAPETAWYSAGIATARTGKDASSLAASNLAREGVSAPAIYQFVSGVQAQSRGTFTDVGKLAMFTTSNRSTIVAGLKQTEAHFAQTQSIPAYAQLKAGVPGDLTKPQYLQILGFVIAKDAATKHGADEQKQWHAAIESGLTQPDKQAVLKTSKQIDGTVFWAKAKLNRENNGS